MEKTNLEKWMELMRLGDRELAEKVGVDKSYVCLLRTGKRPVTDAFRWRFAAVYGYDQARSLLEDATPQPVK